MSQSELARFFDSHIGRYYTSVELAIEFKPIMNKVTLYKNLNRLIKRKRYNCIITHRQGSNKLTAMYGREE